MEVQNEIWLIVDGWKPTYLCFRILSVLSERISFVSTYRISQIHHSILFYINTTRQQTNKNCLVSSLNLQTFVKEGKQNNRFRSPSVTHHTAVAVPSNTVLESNIETFSHVWPLFSQISLQSSDHLIQNNFFLDSRWLHPIQFET